MRNKALRKVKKTYLFDDLIAYKRAQADVRRVIRVNKRKYWRTFCDEIGESTDISEMWNMIRKMGGIQLYKGVPTLIKDDKYFTSNEEKAEELVEAFVKVHSDSNISDDMRT